MHLRLVTLEATFGGNQPPEQLATIRGINTRRSDCIIFIFLGLELIQESHHWHPEFIIATILLCLVFRLELPTNIREDLTVQSLFGFDRYHTDIVMVQSSK